MSWIGARDVPRVSVRPLAGRAAVALEHEVAPLRFLEAGQALAYNATAAHGALVAHRHDYALRQVVDLGGLCAPALLDAIHGLAEEATRLASELTPRVAPPHVHARVFAHIAD